MTFVFEPARSLLIVVAILVVASVLSLLLSRRNPARKFIGIVITFSLAGVMLLRYRTAELTVDDAGLTADTYGKPVIAWPEVEAVNFIPRLTASTYAPRPNLKTSFRILGYGRARYGWFDSGGDKPALFAVRHFDGEAVVVITSDAAYVFGPDNSRALAQAIAEYVPVSGL